MSYRRLGRRSDHRRAMLRNMATSFLLNGRVETTETRAKELHRLVEKMITLGKRGDLHARRQTMAFLLDETVAKKLFDELGPRYKERSGGYTRVIKTGLRLGDGVQMAILELV